MFSEKTQKQLVLVGGTISALGGIVGGATNVFVNVGGLANLSLPRWASWLASALLVFLGLWLLIKWRARHSVLLRPDALRLSRDKAEHLVGRVEDVENLHSQCFAKLIIFLEGESGSGKSALVRAGLLPRLKGDKSVEPLLLIDSWVDDWEQGALQTLKTALINCSALKPDLPADPASLTKEAAQNESALTEVSKALIKLNDEQKRKPLIIFDQFDDYQARNRDRFLPNNTWLDPATLRAQNSFWNMVANLLEQDKLRCLFVTRSDTAAGLSSVEFLLKPVQAQRLDRVPAPDMSELLLRLTKEGPDGPVIADPESGWNRLRDRIIRDISNQDVVLPQQLKIMLGGIQSLRRLNVAQYERAGGAAGIEAIYVEQRVFSAARKVSIDANQIRAMLLAMIDPSNPSKTLSRLKAQLLEVAAKAGTQAIPPEKLEVALGELERGEVVRSANDLECGEVTYRLDHDYLTRGVVAAERRANRWHYLLKEGARAFGDAGSIATQWRALLPVTEQCQLVWQRLQGKFRYGSERSYALASLTRFTPTALALLFVLFAWAAYLHLSAASAARDRAQAIWRKFDFSSGIESQEVEGVWMLATTTDPRVRQAFVDQFLDSPEDAKRFLRHPEFLLHALVGLDLDWRDRLSGMVISGGLGGRAIRRERPFPFSFEDDPPVDDLVLSQLRSIGASTVGDAFKGIETAKDSDARRAYAVALEELLPTATATEVRSLVGPIVQSLKLKTNPDMLSVLRTSLSIIARQLSSDDARALAQAVLDAIQRETSFYGLSNDLVETFSAILQRMRTPEAGGFAGVIVGSLKESMRPERRALSAKLFRASAYYLETAKARALADPILQLVIINPKSLVAESGTIETMAPFMNPEIARSVAASLLDALKENPYGQTPISSALGAVAAQLSREDAKALTHRLLEDMKGVKDSERVRVSIFVPPLRAAAANLNPDEAGALAVSIFEPIKGAQEIKGEREKDQITSLGIAFGVVAEKLGPNDARALSDTIWEVLQRSKDGTQLGVVASALRATAIHLGADDGRLLVNKLKDAMRLKTVSGGLVAIAQATQAVAPRLTPEDAIAFAEPIVGGLEVPGDSVPPVQAADATPLVRAVAAIAPHLDAENARVLVSRIIAAMKTEKKSDQSSLARVLVALTPRLTPQDARRSAGSMLEAAKGRTSMLSLVVEAFGPHLTPAEMKGAITSIVEDVMRVAVYGGQAVADAVRPIIPYLEAESAQALASALLGAFEIETISRDRLRDYDRYRLRERDYFDRRRLGPSTDERLMEVSRLVPQAIVTSFVATCDRVPGVQGLNLLVSALKLPFVLGAARDEIVKAIKRRNEAVSLRKRGNFWTLVEWLSTQPGVNLSAPPTRKYWLQPRFL